MAQHRQSRILTLNTVIIRAAQSTQRKHFMLYLTLCSKDSLEGTVKGFIYKKVPESAVVCCRCCLRTDLLLLYYFLLLVVVVQRHNE